jgi:glycosyltransferase involved in cell wall biosynthesis
MTQPTCSVVIAAYNAQDTIGQALESVLAQTRQDFEVLVVDDGSTDETSATVKDYARDPRIRLHRQENSGPAAARNAGISLTSGRYVCVLDSDDLWLPRYVESMVSALDRAPDAAFAFTRAWTLDRTTNRVHKRPWSPNARAISDPAELLRALIADNFIFYGITVRRRVLGAVGAYAVSIVGSEDYELSLRIVARGYPAVYVPGPLCVYSERPGSLSRDAQVMLTAARATYTQALDSHDLPPDAEQIARRRMRAVEERLDLLQSSERPPIRLRARTLVADATRSWRRRLALRDQPPPEMSTAFPGLGVGTDAAASDAAVSA